MAFTVTPTSGEGPYTFNAELFDADKIDDVNYALRFYSSNSSVSCPTDASTGSPSNTASAELLASGTYIREQVVSPGTCLGATLVVRDLLTNEIVSTKTVSINNL